MFRATVFAAALCLLLPSARAQNVAVQQPVLQDFSASTSVSVPDRGTALLGGVSSGAAGRTASGLGPFRNRDARGQGYTGSNVTTSVQILDLRAMDEALLATATTSASPSRWQSALTSRHAADRPGVATTSRSTPAKSTEQMLKLERLARESEAAQKHSLAKLYWKAAARHGSTAAVEKLAER